MQLEVEKILKRKRLEGLSWNKDELSELTKLVNDKYYKNIPFGFILCVKEYNLKFWKQRFRRFRDIHNITTLYTLLLRFGKAEAIKRLTSHKVKSSFSSSKEGLILKHGVEKANEICYRKGKSFRNSEVQRVNSLKLKEKRKNNPELYEDKFSINIKYWLNKGFSEQYAKEKLKERQTTFSLDKCIKKHGIDKGTEIFNDRQLRWQDTLKSKSQEEINRINMLKSAVRPKKGETKREYVDRASKFCNTPIYDEEDIKLFITNKYENEGINKFITVEQFMKSLPARIKKIDEVDILALIKQLNLTFPLEQKIFKNGKFYSLKVPEGYLRSSLEIKFYFALKDMGIKFEIERFYPEGKMKSDFYITDLTTHIEIAGIINDEEYSNKMEFKRKNYNALILLPNEVQELIKGIKKNGITSIKRYV